MENLSKFITSRLALRQRQVTDHPDADVLAAFAEGGLLPRERTGVIRHLAECPECREILALMATGEGSEGNLVSSGARRRTAPWRWPWVAALATACLVVAVLRHPSFVRQNQEHPTASPVTIAPPTPAADTSQPMQPQKPEVETAKKEITPRRSSPKMVARAANTPVVKQKTENVIAEVRRAESDSTAAEARSALRAAPPASASQPAPVQNFAPSAASQSRSQRAMAEGGESGFLWRLTESATGTVQKSQDGGKIWESVPVDGRSRFYALAATDAEIWVGGAEGSLFHSVDNGSHWVPVVVADGESRLTDAITRVEVQGRIVRLKTQAGSNWVTLDGGLHWRLE